MLSIIYEDSYIIAVNKPSGLISELSPFEKDTMESRVMDYLKQSKIKPYIGVIHRLDRLTSGIMLFAKKKSSLVAFSKLFESRSIQKTYHALVNKVPYAPKGKLDNYLLKNQLEKHSEVVSSKTKHAQAAHLSFEHLETQKKSILLEIKPSTGRYHQIRAQLAHIGCPITGDSKYGSVDTYNEAGIALHALCLDFVHPFLDGEKSMHLEAPYPNELFDQE